MKTRVAWVVLALFGAAMLLTSMQSSTSTAGTPGAPLDLADATVSSRPITIATTGDSIVFATGQSRIVMRSSGEIVISGKSIMFDAENYIDLNADGNYLALDGLNDKVELVSTYKNRLTLDDVNDNITLQSTNGHLLVMDDKNTKMALQTKNGHRLVLNDQSGSESITLADAKDENVSVIDITNKKLMLTTKNGSADIHAPNGTLDIKATTIKSESKGDHSQKCANMKIEAKQDYSVDATNVKAEATMDYKEKGMNVKSEASMEHKTKGMNVTNEAGVNMQVKGTMVTVQSSGPNTIKGMPVLIN